MKVKRKIVHRKLKIREESELRKKRDIYKTKKEYIHLTRRETRREKKKENRKPEKENKKRGSHRITRPNTEEKREKVRRGDIRGREGSSSSIIKQKKRKRV